MLNKVIRGLNLTGLGFLVPVLRLANGEEPKQQFKLMWLTLGIPLVSIVLFLLLWSVSAAQVKTSLGIVPGPVQVFNASLGLVADHQEQRLKEKKFYQRLEVRNQKKLAADPDAVIKHRKYTGKPTYLDQIGVSLYTVFAGFLLAALIAVPLGVIGGLSPVAMAAFNPIIQIFKPVSPLAWLPIVTMVVSAVYTTQNGMFEKSFLTSAITVTLCSLWPALINTALGVASIDKDLINVGKVLRLGYFSQIFKIVLPSSLTYIFTGLRLSLGVGWMVLIAAEMLAQNPGLGKFVWDEFQNGSSQSLSRIMVAVLTIGIIGMTLDRLMMVLENIFTFGENR